MPLRLSRVHVLVAVSFPVLAACGAAGEVDDTQLSSIAECHERGGSPLFDPDDGRPVELSCPEGLRFIGTFEEPFFGSDGGLCCGSISGRRSAAQYLDSVR
jgi:hypothetical protein